MPRRPVPGEKPLYWMGSAKKDLLAFPEAAKDNVGIALRWHSLAASIQRLNHGKEKVPVFWRLSRITPEILFAPSIQSVFERLFTCCTPSEEIPEGDQARPAGCGIGFAAFETSPEGLPGALCEKMKGTPRSPRVPETSLPT